jgi:hypothetical protein
MPELPKTQAERDKLFERVMKLHRKAQSLMEMGNEAEAQTFMAGVEQMLTLYKLEMSNVEFALMQKADPVKYHGVNMDKYGLGKVRAPAWHCLIIIACCKAHYCHPIFIDKTNHFLLIGRSQDRQVCEFMIVTLLRLAEKLADKAYVAHFYEMKDLGDATLARGYRKSWITGFTHRVVERYEEMLETRERDAQKGSGTALIRINQETAMVKRVTEDIKKGIGGTEAREVNTGKVRNHDGYGDGALAGDEVNLTGTGLAAGKKTDERALGQGQKLIGAGDGKNGN